MPLSEMRGRCSALDVLFKATEQGEVTDVKQVLVLERFRAGMTERIGSETGMMDGASRARERMPGVPADA